MGSSVSSSRDVDTVIPGAYKMKTYELPHELQEAHRNCGHENPAFSRDDDKEYATKQETEWLRWISSQFKKYANTQGAINREEFTKLFSSRPQESFFADRCFALFDENENNTIELEELTRNLKAVNGGSTREKLDFLFKVYDLDGDGRIDRGEMEVVLRACVKQSSIELSRDDLELLTDALFTDADENKDGFITPQEMFDQLEKYPGMLDNLSLSVFDWLKPPAREQTAKKPSTCSLWYLRNNTSYVVFFVIFTCVNLGLFGFSLYQLWDKSVATNIGFSLGFVLNFDCALVILFVLRKINTWLRASVVADFLPLDESIEIHKIVGLVIVVLSVLHAAIVLYALDHLKERVNALNATEFEIKNLTLPVMYGLEYWEYLFTLRSGVGWVGPGFAMLSGLILLVILLVLAVLALPCVRRSGYFEVFYWSHRLYIAFYIFLILHSRIFWMFFVGPGVIFLLELIVRSQLCRIIKYGHIYIKEIYLLPSKVIHLVVERPDAFAYKPGDYVFLNIPKIARYEWHPFTLSSEPERPDVLWLHIRTEGHWTRRLVEYFEKYECRGADDRKEVAEVESGETYRPASDVAYRLAQRGHRNHKFVNVKVHLDGPYGTTTRDIFATEHAVLISSGIGVTPYASILQSIVRRYESIRRQCPNCQHAWTVPCRHDGMSLKKVDFIWINRDQRCFEWFTSLLAQLEMEGSYNSDFDNFLDMQMFMTGAMSKNDLTGVGLRMAMESMYRRNQRDLLTGLKTRIQPGRPDFNAVFGKISREKKGQVKVFYCGNRSLEKTVRTYAEKFGFQFVKEYF